MAGKWESESRSENKNVNVKKRARKFHSLEVNLKVLNQLNREEHSIDIQTAKGPSDSTVRTIHDSADNT
jgi:hypothetical protein